MYIYLKKIKKRKKKLYTAYCNSLFLYTMITEIGIVKTKSFQSLVDTLSLSLTWNLQIFIFLS